MGEHATELSEVRNLVMGLGGHAWRLAQEQDIRGDAGLPDEYLLLPVGPHRLIARLEKAIAVLRRLEAKGYMGFYPMWYEAKTEDDVLRPKQAEFRALSEISGVPVVVGRPADVIDLLRSQGFKL